MGTFVVGLSRKLNNLHWGFWRFFVRVRFIVTGNCGLNCGMATFRTLDGIPSQQFVPEADCPIHDLELKSSKGAITEMKLKPGMTVMVKLNNEVLQFRIVHTGGDGVGKLSLKAPLARMLGAMGIGDWLMWRASVAGSEEMRVELMGVEEAE